jgi:adenine deaminase
LSIQEWVNTRKRLIDVAMGRRPAELLIRNGQWVCVQSGEIIPNTDIALIDGRIAYIGEDCAYTADGSTEIIDADGRFLVPGLLDGHMHVESGMVTVTEFVRAVLPHGTTGMFIDPHEIANVFGLKGVRLMVDEAQVQPIHVWVQVPSCVPSAPGLETAGASITPEDVREAMNWDGIIGLGEMMNFPGVFMGDEDMLAELAATARVGKTIGGHYASSNLGKHFHGYVAGGAQDDHEGTRVEDAVTRARQGMKVMMRLGSAWYDVEAQAPAITELGLDARHFILCTDDSHSGTLVSDGHMDRVVRHAIQQGIAPMNAIQMATLNTAEHFGVATDVGQLAPGRWGDVLLVSDLENLEIDEVIAKGEQVARDRKLSVAIPTYNYPDWAKQSVNVQRELTPEDFKIHTQAGDAVIANVIGVIENQAPTQHLKLEVTPADGQIQVDKERDIAKIALVERHKATGAVQVALVHGFGFTEPCGLATTVAHDSHHMIVVGTDEHSMAIAANWLVEIGGGQVIVKDGEVIGQVELPIAGLMSDETAEIVAEKAESVLAGFRACGCTLNNPNMQMSLLALVVIPALRISDLGLVDVNAFEFIKLIDDELMA